MPETSRTKRPNGYERIIERVFFAHFSAGLTEVAFDREEFAGACRALKIPLPKNLGDVVYSFRYRTVLPEAIRKTAPVGKTWIIKAAGRGRYAFTAVSPLRIQLNERLVETKVPDATPGIIAMYALTDEQALLAEIRYNRLIDVFTGVTCYSLQSHLRTTVPGIGQVETDEIYVGVDKRGAQYVFPVEAKAARETLGSLQVEQDLALCAARFRNLICRPVGAQFMASGAIALFEFENCDGEIRIASERHYRLVAPEQLSPEELGVYAQRPE